MRTVPNELNLLQEIREKWRPRPAVSHKGDFGRIFILAGSRGMTGAVHLAAMAALRTGAGLVTLAVPEAVYPVLARREAEVMTRPFPATVAGSFAMRAAKPVLEFLKTQDVLAAGPGLSQIPETQKFLRKVLKENRLRVVIDADGLNALKGNLDVLKFCRARAVLTPHPGEFQRVFGSVIARSSEGATKQSREIASLSRQGGIARNDVASAIAKKFGIILVLKGHHTVVADPAGRIYVNRTGNPGMATGGAGDVLTGMIAALAGQGFSLWDSARFGVFLHGLAGDLAAKKMGEVSLTAGDILSFLPQAIQRVRKR